MIKSIFRILGRIMLILLVAAVVIGLSYALSATTASAAPRFGPGGDRPFTGQARPEFNNQNGGLPRPPRGPGDEGFRENGSVSRGIFQVVTNILLIGIITWVGVLVFQWSKRRSPASLPEQSDS